MSESRIRPLIIKLSFPIGGLIIIATLAGHFSRYFHPDQFGILPFFGIMFPVMVILLFVILGYWIMSQSKFSIIGILTLLIVWTSLSRTFQLNSEGDKREDSISVMSYNVRLFDYYNWSSVGQTRDWIYEFLKEQEPDILCIQEFYHDNSGYFPTLDTLSELNKIKHMHLENYFSISEERQWGMATLTKYPIVGKGRINFKGTYGNLGIYTDVIIDLDTTRIYNLHLQSVRFDHNDYKLMEDILEKSELEDLKKSRMLLERMHDAWVKRAEQSELMANHISISPYPVIMCADLNDGPVSYTYETVSNGLNNSFVQAGFGIENTYAGMVPFLRIDNIFYSEEFSANNHTVHHYDLSDHYAITAELTKNKIDSYSGKKEKR
jgi:endonuclease/exonuclease/phosphatase family metal-dependent hydrolase